MTSRRVRARRGAGRRRRRCRGRIGRAGLRQAAPGEHDPGHADRHVDVEDPAPAQVADDQPAETGPRIGTTATGRLTVPPSAGRAGRPPAACVISVVSSGSIRPPPAPWSTRKAIRLPTFQAAPDSDRAERGRRSERRSRWSARRTGQGPAAERDDHAEREQVTRDDPLDG